MTSFITSREMIGQRLLVMDMLINQIKELTMEDAKYVVLKEFGAVSNVPFIFPNYIPHNEFVNRLCCGVDNVASAGFVSVCSEGNMHPYGKSVSLGKEMGENDKQILDRMFRTQDYWDSGAGY